MSQLFEIEAGEGRSVLTATSLGVLQAASRSHQLKGRKGEALVAALLEAAKGGI
jgi:hypothetical protein